MAATPDIQVCPGCGSRLQAVDGPTHAYMTSSPACWAAFNVVIAREFGDPGLMDIHGLTVDAWAVQHPGDGSRRAIQSVGLHLARLWVQLDQGSSGRAANRAMLGFAERKADLPEMPPRQVYAVTVADVVDASDPEAHRTAVMIWARAVWADWADQHEFIQRWAMAGSK
ncbi:hypothetical protein IP78_00290 [Brevundimonas sp. AAP58]|nr:hypothetical protein IP78_00290 [Brevundimonas sp. AAP58]